VTVSAFTHPASASAFPNAFICARIEYALDIASCPIRSAPSKKGPSLGKLGPKLGRNNADIGMTPMWVRSQPTPIKFGFRKGFCFLPRNELNRDSLGFCRQKRKGGNGSESQLNPVDKSVRREAERFFLCREEPE
jgi:hypothetical protein